jgi:hypothetical protein
MGVDLRLIYLSFDLPMRWFIWALVYLSVDLSERWYTWALIYLSFGIPERWFFWIDVNMKRNNTQTHLDTTDESYFHLKG